MRRKRPSHQPRERHRHACIRYSEWRSRSCRSRDGVTMPWRLTVRGGNAMTRAYTRWLTDYCKPYADRLCGVAMLPMQSVELAIEEMRYAREALGMRGGFLRPTPYHGKKMISAPMYEPFWTMAEELDFSIGFHEGSTNAMPTVGVDRFEGDRAARHMISHTMEMMLAA